MQAMPDDVIKSITASCVLKARAAMPATLTSMPSRWRQSYGRAALRSAAGFSGRPK